MAARTIIMLMLLLALASFIPFNMHINKTQTELKNRKQKWGAHSVVIMSYIQVMAAAVHLCQL